MIRKTPPVLMAALALLLFATAAMAQPPFTTTTIVNGNLTPIANGAALLAAVAAATPPALIKVEPGTYDLNGGQLVMRNLVDVEGSGRDVTFILSNTAAAFSNATVNVPPNVTAELRDLTVQHRSNASGVGVSISSSTFLLTEVNVETEDEGPTVGIVTINSSPRLNEVFSRASSPTRATGVRIEGGGTVVTDSLAVVGKESSRNVGWEITRDASAIFEQVVALTANAEENIAVLVTQEASAELNTVRGTALGKTAFGLYVTRVATATVKDSTFRSLSDSLSVAFLLDGEARAKATESTFEADPIALDHFNVFAVRLIDAANLDSNQSNYDGTSFAAQNLGGGQGRFGASQLIGSVFSSSITGLQCIFSYRGAYTARNAQCL